MIEACPLHIDAHSREIANRGTPMFPCGGYITCVGSAVNQNIPWHWHNEIEVLAVRSGTLLLKFAGGEYAIKEGQGAFINTEVLQSATAEEGRDCEILTLVFHPDLIAGMAHGIVEQAYVRPLLESSAIPFVCFGEGAPWHREAMQCIFAAFNAYRSESFGYEITVREKLSHLWLLIVSNHRESLSERTAPSREAFRLKKMLSYIHTHYAEQLSLSEIAKAASIGERECLRCFKRTIGVSPMQYVLRHRLSVAADKIAKTDAGIAEICIECGFESPSYFSLLFKKNMDMTPKEYRRYTNAGNRKSASVALATAIAE